MHVSVASKEGMKAEESANVRANEDQMDVTYKHTRAGPRVSHLHDLACDASYMRCNGRDQRGFFAKKRTLLTDKRTPD